MNERRSRQSPPPHSTSPLLISLLGVGLLFFLFFGVKSLLSREADTPVALEQTSTTQSTSNSATGDSSRPTASDTAPSTPSQPSSNPVSTSPVATTPAATTPTEPQAAVKMTTVDDSYFSDALFIGDSRTDGLCLYSTPGACKHFCTESLTIFTIMTKKLDAYGFPDLRSLLQGMQFGKVYIMLGINECGSDTNEFAKEYRRVVEEIRQYQPHALIYIQSICYVTQSYEERDSQFATSNIKKKNEAIKQLANDKDIFYLEVNDCLNDGTDHLPAEYTGDGAHLKANYYYLWHDYLLQHAVVDAEHPWPIDESEQVGAKVEDP